MTGPRIVILDGDATDLEIAAVTAALDARRRDSVATKQPSPRRPSRWVRAARLESRGHPPIESPSELSR
ncbi:MAG TPA: acyl-CoA carboxylase epsilon subunit [Euzebyales bacterium]